MQVVSREPNVFPYRVLGPVAATRDGEEIALGGEKQRAVFAMLVGRAGQAIDRDVLLEGVWDYNFDPQTNVIDVHVSRLRQKIDKGFDQPLLHTVRGAGYVLKAP